MNNFYYKYIHYLIVSISLILFSYCLPYYEFKKIQYKNDSSLIYKQEAARIYLPFVMQASKVLNKKYLVYYSIVLLWTYSIALMATISDTEINNNPCNYNDKFDLIASLSDCRDMYIERKVLNSCILLNMDWSNNPVIYSNDFLTATPVHWYSILFINGENSYMIFRM
ncbi:MAG: hypothetical protein KatS3mg129_1022 [Leptospiraceae bacterium]|nr:MAG: hypothetical protein KatS3mg129_1022 [Leptospiraceae bacterium]